MFKVLFLGFISFAIFAQNIELEQFKKMEDESILEAMRVEFGFTGKSLQEIISSIQSFSDPQNMNLYSAFMHLRHSDAGLAKAILDAQMNAFSASQKESVNVLSLLRQSLNQKLKIIDLQEKDLYDEKSAVDFKNKWLNYSLSFVNYPFNLKAMNDFNTILQSLNKHEMGGVFININDVLILNDERIAKVLSEVALEIDYYIRNPLNKNEESLHIDEVFLKKLTQYNYSPKQAKKILTTLMGLYAQRGAAWASSAFAAMLLGMEKDINQSAFKTSLYAMSYIASGISVLDKIQWQSHHKLFSYPRAIEDQNLLVGKPYYFWLSYYLVSKVENSSVATIKAVTLLNEIYQLSATFNGRDPYEILRIKNKNDYYVLGRSVDEVNSLLGSAYALNQKNISFQNTWEHLRKYSRVIDQDIDLSFIYTPVNQKRVMKNELVDNIYYHDEKATLFLKSSGLYLSLNDNKKNIEIVKDDRFIIYDPKVMILDDYLITEVISISKNSPGTQRSLYYVNKKTDLIDAVLNIDIENNVFFLNNKLHLLEDRKVYSYTPNNGKIVSEELTKFFTENNLFIGTMKQYNRSKIIVLENRIINLNDHSILDIQNPSSDLALLLKKSSLEYIVDNKTLIFYGMVSSESGSAFAQVDIDLQSGKIIQQKRIPLPPESIDFKFLHESVSFKNKKISFLAQSINAGQEIFSYEEDANGQFIKSKKIFSEKSFFIDRFSNYLKNKILGTTNVLTTKEISEKAIPPFNSLYVKTPYFDLKNLPFSLFNKMNKAYDALVPARKTINKVFGCNWFFIKS